MAPSSKQADRKKGKVQEQAEEPAAKSNGDIVAKIKGLFMGSVLVKSVKEVQEIVEQIKNGDGVPNIAPVKKEEGETEGDAMKDLMGNMKAAIGPQGDDAGAPDAKEEDASLAGKFASLKKRLGGGAMWCNVLGLAEPADGESAMKAWKELKGLELDFGPRAKKKGNPALDRVKANMSNNFAQYLHVLLALMMLRGFLFRSYFACLPWTVGYLILSLEFPLGSFPAVLLDKLPQLSQVPVDKVLVEHRLLASFVLHALVWLFFAYEVLYCTYFLEKIPLIGIFAYHAYAVRPQGE